jgi:hypothetical protein
MTKEDLIFDWKKSESRGRDKLLAFTVVALSFAAFAGLVELSVPTFRSPPAQGAALIRFADEGMARSWLLEAEENGPFPGRLEVSDQDWAATILEGGRLDVWTDYRASLRPLREEEVVGRVEISPKGKRVFPTLPGEKSGQAEVSPRGAIRRLPILIPYDSAAQMWMPEEIPEFTLPAGVEITPDSLRFAVNLREDGGVAEAIPMAGGADPSLQALERWLRDVRFKEGTGERWFGLRVDFVNRREDDAQPE